MLSSKFRRCCWGALALAFVAGVQFSSGAVASDGELQRVLLDAGCPSATVNQLPGENPQVRTFEAKCLAASNTVIGVVCIQSRCMVSPKRAE